MRLNVKAATRTRRTCIYTTGIKFDATSGSERQCSYWCGTELLTWNQAECPTLFSGQAIEFIYNSKLINFCLLLLYTRFFSCQKRRDTPRFSVTLVQKGRRQATSVHGDWKPSINRLLIKLLEHL